MELLDTFGNWNDWHRPGHEDRRLNLEWLANFNQYGKDNVGSLCIDYIDSIIKEKGDIDSEYLTSIESLDGNVVDGVAELTTI